MDYKHCSVTDNNEDWSWWIHTGAVIAIVVSIVMTLCCLLVLRTVQLKSRPGLMLPWVVVSSLAIIALNIVAIAAVVVAVKQAVAAPNKDKIDERREEYLSALGLFIGGGFGPMVAAGI